MSIKSYLYPAHAVRELIIRLEVHAKRHQFARLFECFESAQEQAS